jgi:hypothetical protein
MLRARSAGTAFRGPKEGSLALNVRSRFLDYLSSIRRVRHRHGFAAGVDWSYLYGLEPPESP